MRFMAALERKWPGVESHENMRRHLGTPTSVGSARNRSVLPDKSGVPISRRQQLRGTATMSRRIRRSLPGFLNLNLFLNLNPRGWVERDYEKD
jgi:hypothetical protein